MVSHSTTLTKINSCVEVWKHRQYTSINICMVNINGSWIEPATASAEPYNLYKIRTKSLTPQHKITCPVN